VAGLTGLIPGRCRFLSGDRRVEEDGGRNSGSIQEFIGGSQGGTGGTALRSAVIRPWTGKQW
jgi:hypothetical protein